MNEKDKIQSISDLMWTVEDETVDNIQPAKSQVSLKANCGGGCCVACCCDIPSLVTQWICPN